MMTDLIVKWSGRQISLNNFSPDFTVHDLRIKLFEKTSVLPERQKLLNLKYKGKPAPDNMKISSLELRNGFKIMMMGSVETDIKEVSDKPEDIPDVINDLDEEVVDSVSVENDPIYLEKIERRVREYSIKVINEPRAGKHLLVLDIDYTLFDHRTPAENGQQLMRPFLHQFLTSAYEDYDIVIWSATSMKWIEEKMKLMGCDLHPDFKITFYLDSLAMISLHLPQYGLVDVKPLGVIWGKYPNFYTRQNTIMFDDLRRNFLMNPQNGLRIRSFRNAHVNRQNDNELLKLAKYLKNIARLPNFTSLKHRNWEREI